MFEYGEGADASYGCGATLMGEMWYFGGRDRRQVWILNRGESRRYSLKKVDDPKRRPLSDPPYTFGQKTVQLTKALSTLAQNIVHFTPRPSDFPFRTVHSPLTLNFYYWNNLIIYFRRVKSKVAHWFDKEICLLISWTAHATHFLNQFHEFSSVLKGIILKFATRKCSI